jgi:hypothetical protein
VLSDKDDLTARLERIRQLTSRLAALKSQSAEAQELVERIRQELEFTRDNVVIKDNPTRD